MTVTPLPSQVPSPSRIVHYVSHGTPVRADGSQAFASRCRAAIVTEVDPSSVHSRVGLCVVNPTGLFFHSVADGGCDYDPTAKVGGSWHWPERTGGALEGVVQVGEIHSADWNAYIDALSDGRHRVGQPWPPAREAEAAQRMVDDMHGGADD